MSLGVSGQFRFADQKVFNGLVPPEGPRCIPVPLDFSVNASQEFDFFMQSQLTYLTFVQSIFADNASNDAPMVIVWNGTQQRTIIPPRSQGYLPVLVFAPFKFTVTCVGGTTGQLQLLNVPMPLGVWSAVQTAPAFTPGGAMLVSDAALDAIIAGGYLNVLPAVMGSGDIVRPNFRADSLITDTVDGSASPYLLITGAPGYFLNGYDLRFSGDATLAAPGIVTLQLLDDAVVIAEQDVWLPNVAITNLPIIPAMRQDNLGFISDFAAGELTLVMSATLATGSLSLTVAAGLTAVVR